MQDFIRPNQDLVVRDTRTSKGRGVFADRAYRKNETVEVSPVLLLEVSFEDLPGYLQNIVYDWGYLTGSGQPAHAIALGVGSLLNHSDTPNLAFSAAPSLRAIRFTATRDVAPGEELCVNYNQDMAPGEKDWFEALGIARTDQS